MKLVIFDFDGVLANTVEFSYNIHTKKNKDLTWKHFQDYSLGNFWEGYEKAVKDGKHIPADDFHGDYKKNLDMLTVEKILHDLILFLEKKYRLVIVSSTNSTHINDFLIRENIAECFSDILGADVHKNKTFKIKTILEKYNLSPVDTVFITDTLGDIKEATECKVGSIAVTWGLHDRLILEKGNPVHIIDNPQDLIEAIESVLK
ncbi:MAG: HAD hydrolase-like protein [Candidatus Paceibacterota bacterium]|jgi:phosphoglycolate phosphatase-like HAD superfamily hydrolase